MPDSGVTAIPRIIHQTWKDESIPYHVYDRRWVESWPLHHPDWAVVLWTDKRLRELGRACYPECEPMLGNDVPGIFLADLGRYMVLHRFGGLYADLDYECLKNFAPLLEGREFVTSYTDETTMELNNALIVSVPDHPLLRRYIDACLQRWSAAKATDRLSIGPGPITGPTMMTEISAEYLQVGVTPITVYESRLLCPINWRSGQSMHRKTISAEDVANVRDTYPEAYAVTYWTHHHGGRDERPERTDLKDVLMTARKWMLERLR